MPDPLRSFAPPLRPAAEFMQPPLAHADPWSTFELELDHLVVAAGSLGAGSAWLQERLGIALRPGGHHLGWGTHNRLLDLGHRTYLELIAPDPTQAPPPSPRPFGIDRSELRAAINRQPRLVHFVMRTPRLDAAREALGYDPGPARAMSRGELRWRITLPPDGSTAGGGLLPTLIQWEVELARSHPCAVLPASGVTLEELRIAAPTRWLAILAGIDRDPRVRLDPDEHGVASGLSAALTTPNGPVVLR